MNSLSLGALYQPKLGFFYEIGEKSLENGMP